MKIAVMLMLASGMNAFAGLPEEITHVRCRKQMEKVLKENESRDKWVRTVDPQARVMAFKSPTSQFARWVEVQTFDDPYVFVYETKRSHVYRWNGKTCALDISTDTPPMNAISHRKATFTDKKLKALMNSGKKAMLYVWSPTMTYSLTEMHVFKEVAKAMNLEFIPLLDPDQPEAEAQRVVSQFDSSVKIEKVASLELLMRDPAAHFPSTFIVAEKKISQRIFGVMNHEILTQEVQKKLADLSGEE